MDPDGEGPDDSTLEFLGGLKERMERRRKIYMADLPPETRANMKPITLDFKRSSKPPPETKDTMELKQSYTELPKPREKLTEMSPNVEPEPSREPESESESDSEMTPPPEPAPTPDKQRLYRPEIKSVPQETEESDEEENFEEEQEPPQRLRPQLTLPSASGPRPSPGGRLSRLNALASNINAWEDDLSHYVSPQSRFNISTPKSGQGRKSVLAPSSTLVSDNKMESQGFVSSNSKSKLTYDYKDTKKPAVETKAKMTPIKLSPKKDQGIEKKKENVETKFTKTQMTSPVRQPIERVTVADVQTPRAKLSVAQKTALFESKSDLRLQPEPKDPSLLTVAERAKLFESQGLFAGVGKTRSSTRIGAGPAKATGSTLSKVVASSEKVQLKYRPSTAAPKGNVVNQRRLFEAQKQQKEESEPKAEERMPVKASAPAPVDKNPPPPPPMPIGETLTPTKSSLRSPTKIETQRRSRSSTPSKRSASPTLTVSPKRSSPKARYPGACDVKRIKVNDPKPGKMYPSLTDIEATETETEAEGDVDLAIDEAMDFDDGQDSETSQVSAASLGMQIQKMAKAEVPETFQTPTPRRNRHHRPTEDFSASLACRQIDELIDDALEGQDFTMDTVIEPPKPTSTSTPKESSGNLQVADGDWKITEEVSRKSGSRSTEDSDTLKEQTVIQVKTDTDASPNDNELVEFPQDSSLMMASSPLINKGKKSPVGTPLMHTVSVYRKQRVERTATPVRTVVLPGRSEKGLAPKPPAAEGSNASVNEQIRKLEDEINNQIRFMSQASKALSLCSATIEFYESTERVEAEKILLLATKKRTALLNEIHRLKTEGVLSRMAVLSPGKHDLSPTCHGNMTISNVSIQLRREFERKLGLQEVIYHFVCIARYRDQQVGSSISSLECGQGSGSMVNFANEFKMKNLEPDFAVTLDFYVLKSLKELLPHDTKYHINKNLKNDGKAVKMTPKKGTKDALTMGIKPSPAGPDAIRTTNFNHCGSLTIDISNMQRTHWKMEDITSPLDGTATLKIDCSAEGGVEERGFLTLFDDVSGFGAWHRRWFKLTPSELSYWMYPEDENKKAPLGSISLRQCVTSHVGPVSRETCARVNTFLLVTTRTRQADDKNSLILSCHSGYTAIKHLLSADGSEERDLWCKKVNRALANLRAWDPKAHSPDDTLF